MFEILKTKQSRKHVLDIYFFINSLTENNWFYSLYGIEQNENAIYCDTKRGFENIWEQRTVIL